MTMTHGETPIKINFLGYTSYEPFDVLITARCLWQRQAFHEPDFPSYPTCSKTTLPDCCCLSELSPVRCAWLRVEHSFSSPASYCSCSACNLLAPPFAFSMKYILMADEICLIGYCLLLLLVSTGQKCDFSIASYCSQALFTSFES